ncbi:MAG: SPOR domain-containing protein [Microlunatus sp.]|nr:SPOR domain-containing protein [Microlunatus sp.]MDN5770382.1 SPOR domain-containing protein [Microlunatus sp.]
MAEKHFWYDLLTKSVITDDNDTKAVNRLGPYATRDEAEQALAKIEENNRAWDEDDDWGED